jgi:hypothetical protein
MAPRMGPFPDGPQPSGLLRPPKSGVPFPALAPKTDRCSLICTLCAEPFDDRAWLFELKLNAESFGREMG